MSDWPAVDGALERTFTFADFVEAMAFVNGVAEGKVKVVLTREQLEQLYRAPVDMVRR